MAAGNVLASEINGSWVDEYTPAGHVQWTVHIPSVNDPSDPQQEGPDLYLMTDYDPPAEGCALEFTRSGKFTWLYDARSGDAMLRTQVMTIGRHLQTVEFRHPSPRGQPAKRPSPRDVSSRIEQFPCSHVDRH